jgi:MFS family permease
MNTLPPGSSNGIKARLQKTFRSFKRHNYRVWAAGSFVSNVGTWMQRIAQDWLVLTQLTHNSGTAVGVVMALQFGPPIVLLPLVGVVADRVDRRKMLLATQSAMAVTALALGALVLTGVVTLWQVYVFAGLMGCISAFDAPVRQTFVAELVEDDDLPNAIALNSTLFNSARLIGPAIAGVLIAAIGTGWLFILNGLSFVAVLTSLKKMRISELRQKSKVGKPRIAMADGLRYVKHKPDIAITLLMVFLIGTYGLNFPIFISTMSVTTFHGGPHLYGALASALAVGSVLGALLAAGREQPRLTILAASAGGFGVLCAVAAVMPNVWLFGLVLVVLGAMSQTFTTSANSLVQFRTEPAMRGRVMAIYMAVFMGCTPLGAPMVGWVADTLGPRWALGVGACAGFAATLVALAYHRHGTKKLQARV